MFFPLPAEFSAFKLYFDAIFRYTTAAFSRATIVALKASNVLHPSFGTLVEVGSTKHDSAVIFCPGIVMYKRLSFRLIVAVIFSFMPFVFAQTSVITYQGKLNNNGSAASGVYDLRFAVYDAVTNGNSLAAVTNAPTTVSNGLFTVQLDFGANVFNGNARWLEIGVRTNGSVGAYVLLNPRQAVSSTPYAIQAANAAAAVTAASVPASGLTGQLSDARLSTNVALLNGNARFTGAVTANSFVGDARNLTNLFIDSLAYWSNAVQSWGNDSWGQSSAPPVSSQFVAISCGGYYTLGLKADGTVSAWGDNYFNELGVPAGLNNVAAISAGFYHGLALKSNGSVVAWGFNDYGETNVPALSGVVKVSAGLYHSMALKNDGTVVCWGGNFFGECTPPSGLSNVTAIAAGHYQSLALRNDGTVAAWGASTNVPSNVTNVVAIAAGATHSLALKGDGTVAAWGSNTIGQLNVPAGLSNVVAISSTDSHSLALKQDGTVVGWGWNDDAQATVPQGLSNVVAIAAGGIHSVALYKRLAPVSIARLDTNNVFHGSITAEGTITGNGSGLTNLDATNLIGSISDSRLSANVALRNASQIFTGVNTFSNAAGNFSGNLTGNGIGLTNLHAGSLAAGTISDTRLSSNVALRDASQAFTGANTFATASGNFSGNGNGLTNLNLTGNGANLTNLNASRLAGGTVADARLSTNVALRNATQTFTGTNSFNNPSNSFTGTFSGDGAGLQNLNALAMKGFLNVTSRVFNIAQIDNTFSAESVAVSGNYAYLAAGGSGLLIYDVNNPANPVLISSIDNGGSALDVAVSGNYAYVANYTDGLRIYNITNPASPINVGHIFNNGAGEGVAVSGNYVYLANNTDGLRVYNVANPASPISVGIINNGGSARDVAVSGNYAYVANDTDGLRIYNISNPASPVPVGHILDFGAAMGVAVSGKYVYLANSDDGLRIYDVSNPASPTGIGHIDDGGVARDVAVSGNYAFLANGVDGLRMYDVSNPANPINIDHLNTGYSAGIAIAGDYAYVADLGNGAMYICGIGTITGSFFQGNGSLLTGLNATNISNGTLADARLSSNVALRNANQTFSGNNALTGANTFTGTTTFSNQVGIGASPYGGGPKLLVAATTANAGDNTANFTAPAIGGNVSHIHYGTTGDWYIRSAVSYGKVIIQDFGGNVGIGTNNPLFKLHVIGDIYASGAIAQGSDRNSKTDIEAIEPGSVLEKVAALPISQWRYKEEKEGVKHIGPMAQDFHEAFGLGVHETSITTVDEGGVALAAIQGLNQKLSEELKRRDAENAELKQRLSELERLVREISPRR